jgi:Penicillin-insensitive murein endopeptidase
VRPRLQAVAPPRPQAVARAGAPAGMPAYRLRRRTAGLSAAGCTVAAFIAFATTTTAAQHSGGLTKGPRQAMLSPATRAGGADPHVGWRRSRALGLPFAGSLSNATKLPARGPHFVTWDYNRHASPSPASRRWGTDRLIRVILRVADAYSRAHPDAPRIVIGDLSMRHGGSFGTGAHASHQNGLDADIYYPRLDRHERAPMAVGQIDHGLAQDLVNRFVRAGAQFVFVGPNTRLRGKGGVVMVWPNHDNHLHVRLRPG